MMLALALWTWLGAPALLLAVLLLAWRLSPLRDSAPRPASRRSATIRDDQADSRALRDDVSELLARLEHTFARAESQAARRLAQLEQALRDADERVDRLEAALAAVESWRHGRVEAARAGLAADRAGDDGAAKPPGRSRRAAESISALRVDRKLAVPPETTPAESGTATGSTSADGDPALHVADNADHPRLADFAPDPRPAAEAVDPRATDACRVADDGRYQDVYDLADRGTPPGAIGRQLALPVGEVELILSLRPLR
ncbi:MAG: hypothetical protein CHACPFDD_04052 [Phycisphaerae bacterium]|nr:hypothetical protein [Phycisphaerae bacterium]